MTKLTTVDNCEILSVVSWIKMLVHLQTYSLGSAFVGPRKCLIPLLPPSPLKKGADLMQLTAGSLSYFSFDGGRLYRDKTL